MPIDFSWNMLKDFSLAGNDCFSFQEVVDKYPKKDSVYLSKVLSKMVDKGMLIKLVHGLYHIVPLNANANHYLPDWHLVSKYIMQGKPYYVGYFSAMEIHGLTTQPSLKEIIVTDQQPSSSTRKIQGIEFQFVTHIPSRFFGYKNIWINQYDKVMVSDLEKTIVDAVTRPHLGGGIVEISKAIYESRQAIKRDTLFKYFQQNGSQAAIKRYLFICELFQIDPLFSIQDVLRKPQNSYSLLDTSAPNQGAKNSRFGLKINLDPDTLKHAIYT